MATGTREEEVAQGEETQYSRITSNHAVGTKRDWCLDTMDSPVGVIRLAADSLGLVALVFTRQNDVWLDAAEHHKSSPMDDYFPRAVGAVRPADIVAKAKEQLDPYFAGDRRDFDLPLAPRGTDFQRQVWQALSRIPFGSRATYGDLAAGLGRPRATRAVGAANGRNPLSIVLPCHRVVGACGALTGYAGGLDIKKWLLQHEARLSRSR